MELYIRDELVGGSSEIRALHTSAQAQAAVSLWSLEVRRGGNWSGRNTVLLQHVPTTSQRTPGGRQQFNMIEI